MKKKLLCILAGLMLLTQTNVVNAFNNQRRDISAESSFIEQNMNIPSTKITPGTKFYLEKLSMTLEINGRIENPNNAILNLYMNKSLPNLGIKNLRNSVTGTFELSEVDFSKCFSEVTFNSNYRLNDEFSLGTNTVFQHFPCFERIKANLFMNILLKEGLELKTSATYDNPDNQEKQAKGQLDIIFKPSNIKLNIRAGITTGLYGGSHLTQSYIYIKYNF